LSGKASPHPRVRPRLLTFAVAAAASVFVAAALGGMIAGLAGAQGAMLGAFATNAIAAALVATVSAWLLRRESASLVALGLPDSIPRWRELGIATALGIALFAGIALVQSAMVGAA